jgi:hypothetical protein
MNPPGAHFIGFRGSNDQTDLIFMCSCGYSFSGTSREAAIAAAQHLKENRDAAQAANARPASRT